MAGRRTRSMNGASLDSVRTSAARTAAIAAQLQQECSILLELYRKREGFSADVADGRLVSVPPSSSQLETRDKLWRLHSALLQCYSLLERAIAKEEVELGGQEEGEYEKQRRTVKDRLSFLLISTGELLKAADSTTVLTPSLEGLELDGPTTVFELKLWVYRIFKEVDHWTKTAISTLQELLSGVAKARPRTMRFRSTRNTRR
ncbi:ciliary neurotrophic factor [Melanotaenia boesemani]|uniref:ciliary neurotrophic factor n=1 Tax=Melanotaenia boesemani TaxID=1250792 RepID=UPI001C03F009|nr:ciliary neurotrophic factor [Melanotaenia boesemani]